MDSVEKTKNFGQLIGASLCGAEVIELIGDIGAGKTTFVKGLAVGLGIDENIQSPSFTISRVYDGRDDIKLVHYDFYRLNDIGIMKNELQDAMADSKNVIVIEWSGLIEDLLPKDRLSIEFKTIAENSRKIICHSGGLVSDNLIRKVSK